MAYLCLRKRYPTGSLCPHFRVKFKRTSDGDAANQTKDGTPRDRSGQGSMKPTRSPSPAFRIGYGWAVGEFQTRIKDMARQKQWIRTTRAPRPAPADEVEKRAIISACETFIREVLRPRFLPEIRPTEWNYVVDIHGAWAAGRYRFMQRYRSGMEHNRGEESMHPSPVLTAWDRIVSISTGCGTRANGGGSMPV